MVATNGQAQPDPDAEIGAGDAAILLDQLKLTNSKSFKILASQFFYGDEEQDLASPDITFTFIDNPDPQVAGSIINFKAHRHGDRKRVNLNLQHVVIHSMSFSHDTQLGPVMVLAVPPVVSLSLQYNLQTGLQYKNYAEKQVISCDGLYAHLTFVLKSWPENSKMYMSYDLDGSEELKDYESLLIHAKEYESIRSAEDRVKGTSRRVIIQRNRHPQPPYFNVLEKTETDQVIDYIGLKLAPERDPEGNVIYRPLNASETEDEGIGSSNEASAPERQRVPSLSNSVSGNSPRGLLLRPGVAKSLSPTKRVIQRAPGAQTGSVATIRIVHPPEGQKNARGVVVTARGAATGVPKAQSVGPVRVAVTPSTSQGQVPSVSLPTQKRATLRKKNPVFVALDDEDEVSQGSTASTSSSGSHTPQPSTPEPHAGLGPLGDFTEDTPLLDFPKNAGSNEGIHIKVKDMQRIAMSELLNDTIIEFGIKYIFHKLNGEQLRKDAHVFSTFFFSSFAPNPPTDKQGFIYLPSNAERRKHFLKNTYSRVKRWTRKVDIFKKKYIVIPVNSDMHWYLIIVANPGKALRKKNEPMDEPEDPEDVCQVFLLDSLPDPEEPKRSCILPIVRDYLNLEFEDKKKKSEPNLYFSSEHVRRVRIQGLPVQRNLVDCGVYLLAYMEYFFHNPPKVPQSMVLHVSDWCPFLRLGYIDFYRDKIIARIKGLCGPQKWKAFERYEREAHEIDPQTARVTVYSESDLVNLGRRPRRHECYCCPDAVKPETVRTRCVSLPPPGVIVPVIDRVKHKHD